MCDERWCTKEDVNILIVFQLDEDEDVYDVVDEEKYAQIVEERRNAGDFVVDDGT